MTDTAALADFVLDVEYGDLSDTVTDELKKRVLDSIGIGIGALGHDPVGIVHDTVTAMGTDGACTLWGTGEQVAPPQAAMMNTTLTRFLDYMDSFLAPGETPHPSDNIASTVVCGEYADASGTELLEGVAIAYEVQEELAWNAPVRDRGWDHVTHTIFSATAASAKMLDLDREQTMNALGIAGTAHNALRVTRTGAIGMWKGIASANTARNAVYSAMLARNGMEGPQDVFEGEKGWKHIVAGAFDCTFDRDCAAVQKTMTKKYVAETYAQSAVEGLLELVDKHNIDADDIASIHLDTFHGAYQIIGGGAGGDRHTVENREQADHSLPYMLAVAVLDGELLERQYSEERIRQDDVQSLLQNVTIAEDNALTERFEDGKMPAVLTVETAQGETYEIEKSGFDGHPISPASWDMIEHKFRRMTDDRFATDRQDAIIDTVRNLEEHAIADLIALLTR